MDGLSPLYIFTTYKIAWKHSKTDCTESFVVWHLTEQREGQKKAEQKASESIFEYEKSKLRDRSMDGESQHCTIDIPLGKVIRSLLY